MRRRTGIAAFLTVLSAAAVLAGTAAAGASATPATSHGRPVYQDHLLVPGDLLVSESYYVNDPDIVAGQTILPPGCTSGCGTAIANGNYPYVFNNDSVDGSFGVTSPLYLREITPFGQTQDVIPVPSSELSTSFSSKSEGALNLSTDGKYVTFIGYVAPPDVADVSNANTPGVIDPTNPVPGAYYRAVARLSADGRFTFTETNAYSGNNGRAAIEADVDGTYYIYTAGNAGNGSNPQPEGIVLGAGAQISTPSDLPEPQQDPGQPTPAGSFSVTELGDKADKVGKDDNFRGLTIYDNVLYYTKGSGSNGVNTVYFLDTTGTACPDGVGLPAPGATLPTTSIASTYTAASGLASNMCVLKGFPTALAKDATDASDYPFGIWFANPTTLYVADEGSGDNTYANGTYTADAASTTAGLQKWVFNASAGEWQLAYTLQDGLNLGTPYTVPGYPTGINPVTGLPWAPATDGLRNLTGRVNPNGTVTIWAVTSTVSGGGDQGADPNKLVSITDRLDATTLPANESFQTVIPARYDQVVRGVSFTPGTTSGGR
ncbi:hypothetical protein [Trebonia sp.]|uniref:hypothetical protein n=1 Tax=Trebonia sp. TaxID=2767075 RepID=UPI0026117014|nr:hypothetical protein [Trebonia sp.]